MKTRKGFVSNSSTSSYMCDICGEIEAGMDISFDDYDLVSCFNGHTFHLGCVTDEEMKDKLSKAINGDDSSCDKCEDDTECDDCDDDDDKEEVSRYEIPESLCPFCQLREITQDDQNSYLLQKNGTTYAELVKEISEKFSSFNEFRETINKDDEEDKDEDEDNDGDR